MKTSDCVVLVPYYEKIHPEVDITLRDLEKDGYAVWRMPGYAAIDQARNRMAYDAVYKRGYDEIFWIDADVGFEREAVERIRGHGLPISGAAYPFKGWPVMALEPMNVLPIVFGPKGGLVEVRCLATGFLHIRRAALDVMINRLVLPLCATSFSSQIYPFFMPGVFRDGGTYSYLGEDFAFCRRARMAGLKVMLDTTIRLKHFGSYPYQWENVVFPQGISVDGMIYRHDLNHTGSFPAEGRPRVLMSGTSLPVVAHELPKKA